MTGTGGLPLAARYESARDLFRDARRRSQDAERIRQQLASMRERATSLGGGFEPRVSHGSVGDTMGPRVAAMVDQEQALARRQAEDYEVIDLACAALYGRDGRGGLAALVPETWWADVIWWRYVAGARWDEVGEAVRYTPRHCFDVAKTALDIADEAGIFRLTIGQGTAEG